MPADPNLVKAGQEADRLLKPPVTVPIWVLIVIAIVANAVGVLLHV